MRKAFLVLALGSVSVWAASLPDAVKDGDRAAAISLLKQHADVNAPEADGTTALHWAVRQDDREMVDRLIKAGANVKAANRYGVTPLYLACVNGSAPMIANEMLASRRKFAQNVLLNADRGIPKGYARSAASTAL